MSVKELSTNRNEYTSHISRYFSVRNERRIVHEQLDLGVPLEDVAFYAREQVLKFLLEFAAQAHQTSISYIVKKNGIYFPGIHAPVTNMFHEAAIRAGYGSREHAEFKGWQAVEKALSQGEHEMILLSPPSVNAQGMITNGFGDYGFAFLLSKDAHGRLTNTILRYSEEDNLTNTRALGRLIGIQEDEYLREQSYLTRPISMRALSPKIKSQLFRQIGYKQHDRRAATIEQALLNDLLFSQTYGKYLSLLLAPQTQGRQLMECLEAMYERTLELVSLLGYADRPFMGGPAPIAMGGSCPVVGIGSEFAYMPRYEDADAYDTRLTTCPSCKKKLLLYSKHKYAKSISCPCGNSTDCPEAIYTASPRASRTDRQTYEAVLSVSRETWD